AAARRQVDRCPHRHSRRPPAPPGRSAGALPGGPVGAVMRFRVWAPGQSRVRVQVDGTDHAMTAGDNGWWWAEVDISTAAGNAYAFLLGDDDTPLPDPRSAWQPDGVHGPSRVYDHDAFAWTDQAWTGRQLPGA